MISMKELPSLIYKGTAVSPVYVEGGTGVGKTASAYLVANKLNYDVLHINVGASTPVLTNGLYVPKYTENEPTVVDNVVTSKIPTKDRVESRVLNPTLILLDEFPEGSKAMQANLAATFLQGRVGEEELHPSTRIVLTGNPNKVNSEAKTFSASTVSKLIQLKLSDDPVVIGQEWLYWASKNGICSELLGWIGYNPSKAYGFEGTIKGESFCCPRQLTKANSFIKSKDWQIVAGLIGLGAAADLMQFCRAITRLPSYADIINGSVAPSSSQENYAIAGMLVVKAKPEHNKEILKFVGSMPPDSQMVIKKMLVANKVLNPKSQEYRDSCQ